MTKKGMNLERIKIKNKSIIMKLLNDEGPMSRKDISLKIGLTPATVTLLCNEMIGEEIICENGYMKEEKRAGRKKVLLDINYERKFVISIYIGVSNTYIYICDLKANIIKENKFKTNLDIEPDEFLKEISEWVKLLLFEVGKSFIDILGVGVVIPGIVNRERGMSSKEYGLWKQDVYVKKILELYIPTNVIIENNIKAFAKGELIFGIGRTKNNILFLRWGPGVGATMIIENKLYEGYGNKALEIGHYIVDENKERCKCGKRGCLENLVSINCIINEIKEEFSCERTPKVYSKLQGNKELLNENWLSKINLREKDVDEVIKRKIYSKIKIMVRVILNSITLFSPEETIIFGGMFDNKSVEEIFFDLVQEQMFKEGESRVHKSKLSEKINYIGAVAIIVENFFYEGKNKSK